MPLCYSQLTLSDRRRLHQLVERKVPVGEIARQLGRHRSTIYRELKRNTFHDAEFPEYSGYYSGIANDISKERRRRLRKLSRHPQLRELVIDRLEALWSPEQIAGRLLADGVSAVRVCTETIYRFIYCKEDYALKLYRHLPEGRRKRRPRRSRKPCDGSIPFDCRIGPVIFGMVSTINSLRLAPSVRSTWSVLPRGNLIHSYLPQHVPSGDQQFK